MRSNSPEGGSARYLQRPYGVGPRFNPGLPVRDLTASSWRGLLVVPGGAPMPPECLVATRPAGAAPRPAHATPRESAPLTDEVVGVYGRFGVRGEVPPLVLRHPGESGGPGVFELSAT